MSQLHFHIPPSTTLLYMPYPLQNLEHRLFYFCEFSAIFPEFIGFFVGGQLLWLCSLMLGCLAAWLDQLLFEYRLVQWISTASLYCFY
ncbi:MAG TPA: hypothetical protein VGO47_09425 [Chlamydiales bacterium]|jgi:hypothetical protein|nr:hypothetical protein [Chlamydiales bacterium]